MAFMLSFFKPNITVDGYQVAGSWGRTVIPVAPGQHQVHVHVPYFLPSRLGPADTVVAVNPGQGVELEYKAPLIAFTGGSIGAPPQKYKGMALMIVLMSVALVLILCSVLLALIGNTTGS